MIFLPNHNYTGKQIICIIEKKIDDLTLQALAADCIEELNDCTAKIDVLKEIIK